MPMMRWRARERRSARPRQRCRGRRAWPSTRRKFVSREGRWFSCRLASRVTRFADSPDDPRGGLGAEGLRRRGGWVCPAIPGGIRDRRIYPSKWRRRPELLIRAEPRQALVRAIEAQRVAAGGCRGPATDLRMCAHASSHGTTPDCQHAPGRSCRSPRGSAVTRPLYPRTTDASRDERRAVGDRHQDPAGKHRRP